MVEGVDRVVSGGFIEISSLIVLVLVGIHIDELLLRPLSLHLEVGVLI